MAAFNKFSLPLPPTVSGEIPEFMYQQINDLYLAFGNLIEQLNSAYPVMMSPNGHYWKAAISNAGVVTWTDVGTVRP